VIGSDGFGYANDRGNWVKIPQLGRVIIGDRVEIGAPPSMRWMIPVLVMVSSLITSARLHITS
jgi:hypothetical protein